MSKALAAGVAQEVTALGMELLGTVGARGDHLIEKLYRDQKAMDIVEGGKSPDAPFKGAERPRPRTTDDYLREREIEEARAEVLAERKKAEGPGEDNGR